MQSEISTVDGNEGIIKEKETKYTKSGAKARAVELYEEGSNPSEIASTLKKEGFEVSEEGIRKMLLKNSKVVKHVASDLQVAKKFSQMIMDYDKELKGIMGEIKEAREIAKETKDLSAWSALLGRAFQGIELFSKIAGDYKESKIDINIILNQIDDRIRANKGIFSEPIDIDAVIIEEDKKVIKVREEMEEE